MKGKYFTALAVLGAVFLAGCFGAKPAPEIRHYALDPAIEIGAFPATAQTLGMRPLASARPIELPMAFLDANQLLGTYVSDVWAEKPGDVVTRAILDAIVATKRFEDAGNAANMARPDLMLTGELRKFYENRAASPVAAEIEVRLELRAARSPECLWAETLRVVEPMGKDSAKALAEAMNRALAQLAAQAGTAIAQAAPDTAP